ncbi:kinesin-domain-containing protein [Neoconidiobolus thromboides FSU 785]|nr:kinesin-domain-containing protein [Neoconidiobolus thromboides FSU 785]
MTKTNSTSTSSLLVAVRVRPFTIEEKGILNHEEERNSHGINFVNYSNKPKQHGIKQVVFPIGETTIYFDPSTNSDSQLNKNLTARTFRRSQRSLDKKFQFDKVFDEGSSQEVVYYETCTKLLNDLFAGFNATIFAYGATGCGKTYTISGTEAEPGIIFLAAQEIFSRINKESEDKVFPISVSYLEVYNEELRDLLVSKKQQRNLKLMEHSEQGVIVNDLSMHSPKTVEELMDLIKEGNKNRVIGSTNANAISSRSHAVLRITLKQTPKLSSNSTKATISTLSIIDLAGSERASVINNGRHKTEGSNINKSLLALGNCINALAKKENKYIPYRNSKLTRLLKSSLSGNCKTAMIVCLNPSSSYYEESLNTLNYANRAKEIKMKATKNMININTYFSQHNDIIQGLRDEIKKLKEQLKNKRETNVLQNQNSNHGNLLSLEKLQEYQTYRKVAKISYNKYLSKKLNVKKKEFIIKIIQDMMKMLNNYTLFLFNNNPLKCNNRFKKEIKLLMDKLEEEKQLHVKEYPNSIQSMKNDLELHERSFKKVEDNVIHLFGNYLAQILKEDQITMELFYDNKYQQFYNLGLKSMNLQWEILTEDKSNLNSINLIKFNQFIEEYKNTIKDIENLDELDQFKIQPFTPNLLIPNELPKYKLPNLNLLNHQNQSKLSIPINSIKLTNSNNNNNNNNKPRLSMPTNTTLRHQPRLSIPTNITIRHQPRFSIPATTSSKSFNNTQQSKPSIPKNNSTSTISLKSTNESKNQLTSHDPSIPIISNSSPKWITPNKRPFQMILSPTLLAHSQGKLSHPLPSDPLETRRRIRKSPAKERMRFQPEKYIRPSKSALSNNNNNSNNNKQKKRVRIAAYSPPPSRESTLKKEDGSGLRSNNLEEDNFIDNIEEEKDY